MTTKRRKFTNKFKAMVALAAIREQKTLAELSKEFIKREYIYLNPCDNAFELRKVIDNEIPERKYENNKLLIRTHEAA